MNAAPPADPPAAPTAAWERNLAALREHHPVFARELLAAPPVELAWSASRAGPEVATRGVGAAPLALASRFDPEAEATKALAALDDPGVAVAALLGAGLGHGPREALRRFRGGGLVLVFEPDPGQLAAALRRVDATDWLADPTLLLLGPSTDRAALTAALEPHAVLVTQGTRLIVHPVARRLHEGAVGRFGADVAAVTGAARTNLATAMVHAQKTGRNLAENLPVYAAGATTEPLKDAARGRTAVCVAAGPSLAKNAHLLADPAAREAVVVIAAQTALRPLLDRGIRPDFVTALDHSAACARFYEDLPPLPEVTLVAEPTANPVILRGFPGPVRLTRGDRAEALLGPDPGEERPPRSPIPPGATVAHLSVSLAAFLGCTSIVLVGQDLGFSNGLYYCPGTAVHRVWEAELSPWNTVEMMEWQRIARMRGGLQRRAGHGGVPCLTDAQMTAYLQHFERQFRELKEAGVRVVDATEGGLVKAHAEVATLAEALAEAAAPPAPPAPPVSLPPVPAPGLDPAALRRLSDRLRRARRGVRDLQEACAQGQQTLDRMAERVDDPAALREENRRLVALQTRVRRDLADAQALAAGVNVTGRVRRQRAGGRLRRSGATGKDKLLAELARDRDHLDWLGQACAETLELLAMASAATAEASAASAVPMAVAA